MVNFVPAVPCHFCLNLPEPFSQAGNGTLAQPCMYVVSYQCTPPVHFRTDRHAHTVILPVNVAPANSKHGRADIVGFEDLDFFSIHAMDFFSPQPCSYDAAFCAHAAERGMIREMSCVMGRQGSLKSKMRARGQVAGTAVRWSGVAGRIGHVMNVWQGFEIQRGAPVRALDPGGFSGGPLLRSSQPISIVSEPI